MDEVHRDCFWILRHGGWWCKWPIIKGPTPEKGLKPLDVGCGECEHYTTDVINKAIHSDVSDQGMRILELEDDES